MRCYDFQSILVDLARERDVESPARDAAMAHASACADCARSLATERELSRRLSALAAATRDASAPPRVEAALLEAFRAKHAPVAEVVPIASRRPAPWARWALASAAGLTLAVGGLASWRAWQAPVTPEPSSNGREIAAKPFAPPVAPPRHVTPPPSRIEETDPTMTPVSTGSRSAAPRAARRPARPPVEEPLMQNVEFASEFYPLVADGGSTPLDGGQIVRMEVPRASLAAMGLLPSDSRASESVTADVLVGHDGTARAIRFVQSAVMTQRSSLR